MNNSKGKISFLLFGVSVIEINKIKPLKIPKNRSYIFSVSIHSSEMESNKDAAKIENFKIKIYDF